MAGLLLTGACSVPEPRAVTAPAAAGAAVRGPAPTAAPATVSPDAASSSTAGAAPVPSSIPPVPPPVPVTTLSVGAMTLPLVDPSRPTVSGETTISTSRALTTRLWYPETPGGGPWPLVVFAHGYEVGPDPYTALCEAWAKAGYVVAAPEFPLTDADVAGGNLDEYDIENQPDDVRFVIASLLAPGGPLPVRVDPDRLAVAGHSDGGVTALAVATGALPGLRAVIALSASPVGDGSTVNPPTLVAHGDEDDIDPYENGAAVYDRAVAPRYLLTLLGGGHLPPFTEGSAYLDVVDRVAVDFLDLYVAGRTATDAAMTHDAGAEPDLVTLDADP